jgi:hypothetical protein
VQKAPKKCVKKFGAIIQNETQGVCKRELENVFKKLKQLYEMEHKALYKVTRKCVKKIDVII